MQKRSLFASPLVLRQGQQESFWETAGLASITRDQGSKIVFLQKPFNSIFTILALDAFKFKILIFFDQPQIVDRSKSLMKIKKKLKLTKKRSTDEKVD